MATRVRERPTAGQLVDMAWDPITRIVGNLGIYTKIDFGNREVVSCKSTSSLFRGYSVFMKGKDPRDAHFITSRICGICGDNHAVCPARQARIERPHRPHDVDTAEAGLVVLLEDRLARHSILVGTGGAESRSGPTRSSATAPGSTSWPTPPAWRRSTASADRGGNWRSCRRGSRGGAKARRGPPRGSRSRSPARERRSPRTPSCDQP